MEQLKFYKYHGTGNDFVIIDNRDSYFNISDRELISFICHRRFGVGADGFMLLENSPEHAFYMRYYNSDGNESTMCGNGGRCIVKFACDLGMVKENEIFTFDAIDGIHHALVKPDIINLKMLDVNGIEKVADGYFLNTGSPHFVCYTENLEQTDVVSAGRAIRNNSYFGKAGTNVNFVEKCGDSSIMVRTYERGVEDETWSCGTGCVASVLTNFFIHGGGTEYSIKVKGGALTVRFSAQDKGVYNNIWLEGPAKFVFSGNINVQ
ncbi:diaminopimelate epimerase [Alkalitalea saponilacus]|uniref:Diaminopimelate epimerase n=1 Tax=Alkalitalea saponilacus TaxID=889453 RepID=A0A1T5HTE0_9BACT|nr:diaminopimelate epimerase [Alkalitalea saponilacus]ASB50204.1 diaminopimelate epimerase [Alkalitalea saponilacus]SKC23943.1 diaminopimelate epimerase [Alkalitalea saponilacus]